ncbi:MAG TPA: transketolase [Anaerolineae bacterium]|nr:transketolase [Anaerolineae bacterium]
MITDKELEQRMVNTLRFLAADTVQKAQSGHPGTPMGAATIAYVLWDRILKHNPANPNWIDRDRFILSPGHASALLYALLHLTGYDLWLDDLKNFRQWGSKTPGHPEHGLTPGVEVTTGPLGQGFAHGVGMAMAERWLAEHYNSPDFEIINHYTYAIVSDGDLQEGVASEAASLAGTLKLGKLIYLYDDNGIQIEGSTDIAFDEDVSRRFEAYGWHVVGPIDGHDPAAIDVAIRTGQAEMQRPTLIVCRTHIGFGAPKKQDTASAHGEPLGEDELRAAKAALGWPADSTFYIPDDVSAYMRKALDRGREWEQAWQHRAHAWWHAQPDRAEDFDRDTRGELPDGWDAGLTDLFKPGDKPIATREASGRVLNVLASRLHALTGGSADLAPSTKTILKGYGDFGFSEYCGHNLHFGVREHAMGGIVNGMALHGGVIPYAATFLVFCDYMRPPIRLAALMEQRVIYVFTHDSIGLGEDGPTHQPIEHLLALRAIPNLTVIRPADAIETAEAWRAALLNRHGPTTLVLSRQNLPLLDRAQVAPSAGVQRGGYVLWQSSETPEVILIATGSEVHIALEAGKKLAAESIQVSVVSLPSWELFDQQPAEYRESVLLKSVRARVAVEAAQTLGWEHYVGLDGLIIGLDHFGASAPAPVLYEKFGLTGEHIAAQVRQWLNR